MVGIARVHVGFDLSYKLSIEIIKFSHGVTVMADSTLKQRLYLTKHLCKGNKNIFQFETKSLEVRTKDIDIIRYFSHAPGMGDKYHTTDVGV